MLRAAAGELLVLLALHGDQLMGARVGKIALRVEALVGKVLRGASARAWLSRHGDLQLLAEAAPDAFLSAVESDLKSADPQIMAMLRPVSSSPYDGPDRTGLLWALEIVAWHRDYFARVFVILAWLSEVAINDNWANKPENSLASIVRSWWPQTSAPLADRLANVAKFAAGRSGAAWRLLKRELGNDGFTSANAHPRWRNDAACRYVRPADADQFAIRRKALDLLLAWPGYKADQLGQLFEVFEELPGEDQDLLLDRAEQWAGDAPDPDRAELAERLRRQVGWHGHCKGDTAASGRVMMLSKRLEPADPLMRQRWLFADEYVQESWSEVRDDSFDFEAYQYRIAALRTAAVAELHELRGLDGIVDLLRCGKAHGAVGEALGSVVGPDETGRFVAALLDWPDIGMSSAIDSCLFTFVHKLDAPRREALLGEATWTDEQALRLYLVAPFEREIWEMVEVRRPTVAIRYWQKVMLRGWYMSTSDLGFMIDRALDVGRPLATFQAVSLRIKNVAAPDLARILRAIPTAKIAELEAVKIDPWRIGEALAAVADSNVMPVAERAQLEFLFFDALSHGRHGIPALEQSIADNPDEFVHLVTLLFKRDDGQSDGLANDGSNERRDAMLPRVYSLLENLSRIPGTRDDGTIDSGALLAWVTVARNGCTAAGRQTSGDSRIGIILAKAPIGSDGHWPHLAVRDALDAVGTDSICSGFHVGKFNNRGAVWRKPGGSQERDLAKTFRIDAEAIRRDHPFTAHCLSELAADYERQGDQHDTEKAVRKRLGRH